jgi:hypothetical protein
MGLGGNKMKSEILQNRIHAAQIRRKFQGHPKALEIANDMPDDDLVALAKKWEENKMLWAMEDRAAARLIVQEVKPAPKEKKYLGTFSIAGLVGR